MQILSEPIVNVELRADVKLGLISAHESHR